MVSLKRYWIDYYNEIKKCQEISLTKTRPCLSCDCCHVSYTLLLGNDLQFRGLQGPTWTSETKRDPSPTLVLWSSISVQYKDLGLVDVDVLKSMLLKITIRWCEDTNSCVIFFRSVSFLLIIKRMQKLMPAMCKSSIVLKVGLH